MAPRHTHFIGGIDPFLKYVHKPVRHLKKILGNTLGEQNWVYINCDAGLAFGQYTPHLNDLMDIF